MADTLKFSVENPATWVNLMFSDAIQKDMRLNMFFGRLCERYCRKVCPFKVMWKLCYTELGNFLALLKSYAETNPILSKCHLHFTITELHN